MKKKLNNWQYGTLFLCGLLLFFSVAYLAQAYFSYQQVKASSDQCYDLGGYPTLEKSGFQVIFFECNTYDEI